MKRKLSFFFAVLALLLTGQTATAQTFVVGDLSFTVTDAGAKTVSVSKTDGISGNVVIPSSVTYEGDPYSVTAIPNDAFYSSHPLSGMSENYTLYLGRNLQTEDERNYFPGATSVTIGDKVTYINNELFGNASKLASVTMGSGVTSIGEKAFYYSGRDESVAEQTITLGPNVTTIGESAFEGCTHLTSIDLGTKLTAIPVYGFYKCSMLTSITIPASVGSVARRISGGMAQAVIL